MMDLNRFKTLLDSSDQEPLKTEIKECIEGFELQLDAGDIKALEINNLTHLQALMIYILQNNERIIQVPAWSEKEGSLITTILLKELDDALNKLPCTQEKIIYRNTNYDFLKYDKDDIITAKGYFTCSKDNFNHSPIHFCITPLAEGTRAREIFHIYDHILANTPIDKRHLVTPEYQIEFKRGTRFLVRDIITQNGIKKVSLEECS